MRLLVSQPRYLPNLDFICRIISSDLWVVLDHVQRSKRTFENRNYVGNDNKFLTLPIKGSSRQKINEMYIDSPNWSISHKSRLENEYGKHKIIDLLYNDQPRTNFRLLTVSQIIQIVDYLGLKMPRIIFSSSLDINSKGSEMIIDILSNFEAKEYISGPKCIDYGLTKELLSSKGIKLHVFDSNLLMPIIHYICTVGLDETLEYVKQNSLKRTFP